MNSAIIMGAFENGAVKWLDPAPDGELTQADYRLIMSNLGYDNTLGKGDFASLLLGDVNLDGRVTDADRAVLMSAAAEQGIDTSGWTVPEPNTAILLTLSLSAITLVKARPFKTRRQKYRTRRGCRRRFRSRDR